MPCSVVDFLFCRHNGKTTCHYLQPKPEGTSLPYVSDSTKQACFHQELGATTELLRKLASAYT